jgi:hypothetical protein
MIIAGVINVWNVANCRIIIKLQLADRIVDELFLYVWLT